MQGGGCNVKFEKHLKGISISIITFCNWQGVKSSGFGVGACALA